MERLPAWTCHRLAYSRSTDQRHFSDRGVLMRACRQGGVNGSQARPMPGCAIPIRQVDSRCQRTRDAAIRSHGTTHLSFENRSAQRGRGECRASNAPAASRATESRHTSSSHHRSTGTHRHSRTRNGFNGLLRALPGVHDFLVTVARGSSSARLAPAQGCQDHTLGTPKISQ